MCTTSIPLVFRFFLAGFDLAFMEWCSRSGPSRRCGVLSFSFFESLIHDM